MKPSQLSSFLSISIANKLPVLIKGAPGVGKTDIVSQACQDSQANLMVSHPVVSDPTDFKGMPCVVNNEAKFLPFGDLHELIIANSPTVFFLDDLGQAPASVQAAAMNLILSRRINGHVVSPFITFMAATNRRADRAGVQGILEPVKSRFCSIVELTPDMDDWVTWALNNSIPPVLIAFIRFRPNLLFNFFPTPDITNSPCPRTVANVGKLMSVGLDQDVEFEAIAGAAGEAFAVEFMSFLSIYRTLPNPDLILISPDTASVPTDPATLFALCGALAHKTNIQNFHSLVKYALRLPKEFQVLLMLDAKVHCPDIINTPSFIEWASKNQL